jgi:predicted membrane metal-binding protein
MREFLDRSADTPLSEAQMSAAPFSIWRAIGVVLTTLLGFGFFNALIGVFGLWAAIIALLLFIFSAVLIFRRPQTEGEQP